MALFAAAADSLRWSPRRYAPCVFTRGGRLLTAWIQITSDACLAN